MNNRSNRAFLTLLATSVSIAITANGQAVAQDAPSPSTPALDALQYRNVGPTRGGRATAVCGVVQEPGTFYMGATGGGVWKTTDFGNRWRNVSDGFFATPSIGAIRVASTDPALVWVGTGTDGLRSNIIPGRGVYRSQDAGKTWQMMGLENAGQIGAVEIDPTNHDIVYVAAIGNAFAPNEDRGVYKTTDAGASWQRVFHVSPTCGAVDIELHPANPQIVYASMWEAERKPWTIKSGGTEGGVWRSQDGGASWSQLGGGLPTGIVGKSDLAVSFAEPDRIWVLMEAKEKPGLYRSDDRGETFAFISNQRGLLDRPFYYCNIDCDPTDADHLFVCATGFHESTDGGKRWRRRFTPHGDNHEIWIHPENPELMVQCNDGGANVTTDGGSTWSRQDNQPTAELYQIAVDDRFPYWLYAGQQDNSTIRVPSRPPHPAPGGTTSFWESVGGCETGPAVPKPGNPNIVYANCKGRFGVYDHRTGQERQYYVGAESLYGHNPKDLQFRFQRVAPITVSPHDPNRVYHGSQFLHVTEDGGVNWRTMSPDLTAFEADKQVNSGYPITRDITGEEYYSTLYEIAESPVQAGVLWTGANDGPIHVSRDGGRTWQDVTPATAAGGRVQTIEPSWQNPATAYACVLRFQLGDATPHVYRTDDFGANWQRLDNGLPANCPTRVVREDPQDPNVLFLGTEWGMFVSLDRGDSWQSFQQNLPIVPVTDLLVHHDDLVVSTMGRSFWILDDVSAVRALRTAERAQPTLLAPRTAVRTRLRGAGAQIHYALPADVDELRLEIRLASEPDSKPLRTIAARKRSDRQGQGGRAQGNRDQGMRAPFQRGGGRRGLAAEAGLHRYTWDMRRSGLSGTSRGPMVMPGTYELRLVHAGGQSSQTLEVELDPRLAATGVRVADLQAQAEMILRVQELRQRADELTRRIRRLSRAQMMESRATRLEAIRSQLVNANETYPRQMLASQIRYLGSMLDRADQRPGQDTYRRYEQLDKALTKCEQQLAAFEK
ncbi:MAG: hypothetical protein AB8H80_23575 [Planctomycetota bacterium]